MKPDWRQHHVQLYDHVGRLLANFKGELILRPVLGFSRVETDFILKTDRATYLIEIKAMRVGDYLSFATWGQMSTYRSAVEQGGIVKNSEPVIPLLFTNANLPDSLKEAFRKSKIAVIEVEEGEELSTTQKKLEEELVDLALPVPEVQVSSGSQ